MSKQSWINLGLVLLIVAAGLSYRHLVEPGELIIHAPKNSSIEKTTALEKSAETKVADKVKVSKKVIVKISLNHADIKTLTTLPGVGPATAAKIVEFREQKGKFSDLKQLLEIRGIGPAKLAKIKDLVILN